MLPSGLLPVRVNAFYRRDTTGQTQPPNENTPMPTTSATPPTRGCKRKTLERLWQLLPQLQYFSFAANPRQSSTTGWQGRGYGHIDASNDDNGWLLAEHGHFHPAGSTQPLPFRNSYRWQRLGDRLRLSHERFGADNA